VHADRAITITAKLDDRVFVLLPNPSRGGHGWDNRQGDTPDLGCPQFIGMHDSDKGACMSPLLVNKKWLGEYVSSHLICVAMLQ
jgi:hypothetical protein